MKKLITRFCVWWLYGSRDRPLMTRPYVELRSTIVSRQDDHVPEEDIRKCLASDICKMASEYMELRRYDDNGIPCVGDPLGVNRASHWLGILHCVDMRETP